MSMQSERGGDHLDAAIDAAARSLTTGEPSAALRAGVRGRIRVASAFRRKAGWWLVPAGAMTALIAVMIVGRILLDPLGEPEVGRTLSGPPARPTDVRLTSNHVAPPASSGGTDGPDQARPTGAPDKARLTALPSTFEPPVEELEPLIPPITIEPLETRLIVVDTSSGVMPIEIEPLQIEPLRGD